jgi:Domain of unknown function (DUF5666)
MCSIGLRFAQRILPFMIAWAALIASCPAGAAPQAAAHPPVARQVGVIKSISGNSVTLATDAGTEVTVQLASNAILVRVAPGQTDLKSATPIQSSDLEVGDRILVRGELSSDGKSFIAAGVIAMSRSDVEATKERDREDWQKRGIGGLVKSVDPSAGTITISAASMGGTKTVVIQTNKDTVLRRYAPGSIRFDEAKPAPIDEVKPGDQLRARGTRSADGSEFLAAEIVSGSFRNIAGTIRSIDLDGSTMTVMDLITKSPFQVKITNQTQLRELPPDAAQRIAFRLKATPSGRPADAAQGTASAPAESAGAAEGGQGRPAGMGGSRAGGGQADFQQIVSRIPAAALSAFKKDDAVMIVATANGALGEVTAITVLGGVEPILAAAPASSPAMTLSPWSLGGGAPDAEGGEVP